MMRKALLLAGMLAVGVGASVGAQQPTVILRDAGPGPVGRLLQNALNKRDTRVIVGDTVTIPQDVISTGDVVVIGRQANLLGAIKGDLFVVGGDLFVKPRASIEGQGIAIGGGAHGSLLADVTGGLISYRDFTYAAEQTATGIELRYQEQYVGARRSIIDLPAVYGIRIPGYDRSNGLSLAVGPAINFGTSSLDLIATYRSQTGQFDPSAQGHFPIGRSFAVDAFAGRETRTHEGWIGGSLNNSVNSLLSGHDERNWYRATGGWLRASRVFTTSTTTATYSLGGSFERAESVRPGLFPTSSPWSVIERTDVEHGMFRPNPQIPGGDITSVIGGADLFWVSGDVRARFDLDLEVPVDVSTGERFVQTTMHGRIEFPTFGKQRYRLEFHAVGTADSAPAQRFVYLGGSGTLPTEEVLLGHVGDELLYIESRYAIPLARLQIPLVGSPTVTFRHILGSAGIQTLPDFTQIIGLRVAIPFVRLQYVIDTRTREDRFSAGFSLSR